RPGNSMRGRAVHAPSAPRCPTSLGSTHSVRPACASRSAGTPAYSRTAATRWRCG
ncbi:hypothetical protein AB1N83_013049, partial [Pleurotus pulmonarius]